MDTLLAYTCPLGAEVAGKRTPDESIPEDLGPRICADF